MNKYVVGGNEFKNEQGLKDYFITKYSLSDEQKINLEKEIINGKSFEFMGEFVEIIMEQKQDELSLDNLDKKVEEIQQQEKKELPIFSMEKPRKTTKKMKSQGMKL